MEPETELRTVAASLGEAASRLDEVVRLGTVLTERGEQLPIPMQIAIRQHGLQIGTDIGVVGFNDTARLLADEPIESVRLAPTLMARVWTES